MPTHDLSEYSSMTILARIFELEDVGEEAQCGCLPGTVDCELDDVEALYKELEERGYGTDYS